MSRILPHLVIAALLSPGIHLAASSQATPTSCPAPPAVLKSTQPNIFSEQQEQWLGDAMADMMERDYYRPVRDPAQNQYVDRIVKRLLAALPPTTIQFRVLLVDSSDVNGFSLAGGRIYLTWKLVANAKNEDEVASVIGHEMGHILSHQFAIETTADLKRLLGITSVGDKADVYAKFQRLADARLKDKHPGAGGDTDEKQDEADRVAVYATASAGYRPQAYAEFWNRMFFVDGKVGGPLSDFFGATKPESKRLRAILKLVTALPPGCGAIQPTVGPEFERWHTLVIANQAATLDVNVKPFAEVALTPPLRMDLERLRFSRDGKYILAQDESSVSVLSRDPYKILFRFDAEKALPAEFSPNSQRIVFHTPGLHTEEWSVPDRKMLASHEPVARHECLQTKFAPDGRTLFCISLREEGLGIYLDLALLDPATGDVVFQKKDFFEPSFPFFFALALNRMSPTPADLMPSSLSADGNVLLVGPSTAKLAFDLRTRAPIPVGRDLRNNITGAYTFLGNDKVVGVADNVKDSGIFSFPDGKRLQSAAFGLADLQSVTGGDYVLSKSIDNYAVGLADVSQGKFVAASKSPAMDLWDGWMINENGDGTVSMRRYGDDATPHQAALLPLSPLGPGVHASISANGQILCLSTRTRSGVWDLSTGRQLFLARPFTSAFFAPDNALYAEIPKTGKDDRHIARLTLSPPTSWLVPYKEDDNTRLVSGVLQEWKPLGKKGFELIVHSISDNAILWRRTFEPVQPAHAANINPGTTLFSFPLKTDFAKARLKQESTLAAQAATIKDRDAGRLVQQIDDANGNILHEVVLDTPANYDGVAGINIVGDLLYLTSDDNRTMVYTLSSGTLLRQVFGYVIAADPATGRTCTVNRRDEAVVYDAQGQQLANFRMGSPPRFAFFQNTDKAPAGKLTILTADQKVRTMQIPAGLQSASTSP